MVLKLNGVRPVTRFAKPLKISRQAVTKENKEKFQPLVYVVAANSPDTVAFLKALTSNTSYQIALFDTPQATFTAPRPDLLIADMASSASADAIECLKTCFSSPIIALSARPSMAAAVTAMRAGACDFFPKPVSLPALCKRMIGILRDAAFDPRPELPMVHSTPSVAPFLIQERAIIENALNAFNGNITRAAAALQISPSTIHRKRQAWDERQTAFGESGRG